MEATMDVTATLSGSAAASRSRTVTLNDAIAANETNQYLTFRLEEETFALDISKVREVLEYTPVTKVPRTPDFMEGVINVRGSVVPVVDMRVKFGMREGERTVNTCIIIAEVKVDGGRNILGALVDSVQEVIELEPESIARAPGIGMRLDNEFIRGMGRHNDRFVIILDVDRVFSSDEISMMAGGAEG
jgi:purine-binding chemotaxis protein CheW